MANTTAQGRQPESIAFPPVLLAGELQHIFCNAGEADEFLATAHAWLELFVLAQDPSLTEDEVWRRTQAAHDDALLQLRGEGWRTELQSRLEHSLLKFPAYRTIWNTLAAAAPAQRTYH